MLTTFKKVLITVAALVALALGGAALAGATSGDDSEAGDTSTPITGAAETRAGKAALAATGGGRVNETERDDENGATYEVEVAKPDGSQVDVRLDADFDVVVVERDSESDE